GEVQRSEDPPPAPSRKREGVREGPPLLLPRVGGVQRKTPSPALPHLRWGREKNGPSPASRLRRPATSPRRGEVQRSEDPPPAPSRKREGVREDPPLLLPRVGGVQRKTPSPAL